MNAKRCLMLAISVTFGFLAVSDAWSAGPPRNRMVAEKEMLNVKDNDWSNVEWSKEEPAGLYYVEMTEVVGSLGAWGSQVDPYPDGDTYQNDAVVKKSDLRLQYRVNGTYKELVVVPPQGAIGANWNPFPLHGNVSLGQTFVAVDKFNGVGLQTPTWVTVGSGGFMTVYAEKGGLLAVSPRERLATAWARMKTSR